MVSTFDILEHAPKCARQLHGHVSPDPEKANTMTTSPAYLNVVKLLQAQWSSISPDDWEDETKYDIRNIKIWRVWLEFKEVSKIETCPWVYNARLTPCLPWYVKTVNCVTVITHFLTLEEGHSYKNATNADGEYIHHNSNALRSNGTLWSLCWEQQWIGMMDDVYLIQCAKCEAVPFAFNYGNKNLEDWVWRNHLSLYEVH